MGLPLVFMQITVKAVRCIIFYTCITPRLKGFSIGA